MHIAFCNRFDCLSKMGGDTIQMLKTKEKLEEIYDFKVDIVLNPKDPNIAAADLVHLFNLQTFKQTIDFMRRVKQLGKPMVLSTIFWDFSHDIYIRTLSLFGFHQLPDWAERYKFIFDIAARAWGIAIPRPKLRSRNFIRACQEIVEGVDMLLPNSQEELRCLEIAINTKLPNYRVVTNAIDPSLFAMPSDSTKDIKSVICAGRIEPSKNQTRLIRALWDLPDINIKLIGAIGYKPYFRSVEKLAHQRGNVELIPENLPQSQLVDLFSQCRTHVLPSFRESPGLSTLEALAMGCSVVVSERAFCPVDTYFSEYIGIKVFLCNPYSVRSIRDAVIRALSAPMEPSITDDILDRFSWRRAAEQTAEAYFSLLNTNRD